MHALKSRFDSVCFTHCMSIWKYHLFWGVVTCERPSIRAMYCTVLVIWWSGSWNQGRSTRWCTCTQTNNLLKKEEQIIIIIHVIHNCTNRRLNERSSTQECVPAWSSSLCKFSFFLRKENASSVNSADHDIQSIRVINTQLISDHKGQIANRSGNTFTVHGSGVQCCKYSTKLTAAL